MGNGVIPDLAPPAARETVQGYAENGQVFLVNPANGERFTVPKAQAQAAVDGGALPLSRDQVLAERFDAPASTALREGLNAFVPGGLVNAAVRGIGLQSQNEIEQTRRFNPDATLLSTGAGLIGSTALPIGLLGKVAAKAAGGGRLGMAARGFTEAAAIGAQAETAQVSGENVSFGEAAQRIAKSAAVSAAIGGPLSIVIGGALPAVGRLSNKGASFISQAEAKVAQTVGNVFEAFGPLGKVMSKAASGALKGKLLGGALPKALNIASKIGSPAGIHAAQAGFLGITAQALSSPSESADRQLKTDYLAAASDGFEAGAIGPESIPESMLEAAAEGRSAGRPQAGLSPSGVSAVVSAAKLQDPNKHAEAALEGYLAAGSSEASAKAFAEFHRKRIELLSSLSTDGPLVSERASKVTDAVFDPSGAISRISRNNGTREDIEVISKLYPLASDNMSVMAAIALDSKLESKLAERDRIALQQIAGGKHRRRLQAMVDTIQQGFSKQQQQGPDSRVAGLNIPSETTGVQRNQLGG